MGIMRLTLTGAVLGVTALLAVGVADAAPPKKMHRLGYA